MKNKKAALQWIIGFVLLNILVWFQALSKTIQTYTDNASLSLQTDGFLYFQNEMRTKNTPVKTVESTIQHTLFSLVNSLSETHSVKLEEMPAPHSYFQNDIEVTIFKIQLSGSFSGLLKTLHSLEVDLAEGEIKGYSFKKIVNRKTKRESLQLHLWVQSMNIKT